LARDLFSRGAPVSETRKHARVNRTILEEKGRGLRARHVKIPNFDVGSSFGDVVARSLRDYGTGLR